MVVIAACRFRSYEAEASTIDTAHAENVQRIAKAVLDDEDIAEALADCIGRLRSVPLRPAPRRPVVGVACDLYTRLNPAANASPFTRLEDMGCEIWPNPFFAGYEDYVSPRDAVLSMRRVRMGDGLWSLLKVGATSNRARRIREALGPDLEPICVEPDYAQLNELAKPYVGRWTNHYVLCSVGKMVDFVRKGASGVVHAIGLNCMAGIATSAVIPAIRADHDNVPIVNLIYGGTEGPSQKIQLETFVHQVGLRHQGP